MALIKVEVEVSKETYELGKGLAAIAEAVIKAKADGWQMGQDLPVIVASLFGQMTAISGVELIPQEMKEDPAAFAKAITLGLADVYGVVKGQEEVAG